MKKLSILIFFLCLLGLSASTQAQIDKLGFSGSYVNARQLWGKTQLNRTEPLHGFSVFMVLEKYICPNASFRANLGYQKQGYEPLIATHRPAPLSFREGYIAHQIAFDMSIKGYIGKRNNRLYFLSGIRLGQTVASKITEEYVDLVYQLKTSDFKKTKCDAFGGFGFEWKGGIFLETEYAMGIVPVFSYGSRKG